MASAKGLLLDAFSFVTRSARITQARDVGHGVRSIVLAGTHLRDASWTPGDKIQLLLPTKDVRTFTPTRFANGELELITFDHGDAPGSTWARRAKVGDELRFFGPQRSLARGARATVLFGDETSYGLAIAFAAAAKEPLACVFEVGSDAQAQVVGELGIGGATCIVRSARDGHVGEVAGAIASAMRAARSELVMSGRAQSIKLVRDRLRSLGVTEKPDNKAYWSVGKVGLD
jgi:ferric-chelate reductase (NADPH)